MSTQFKLPPLLLLFLPLLLVSAATAATFKCANTNSNCSALLGFVPTNTTTYSSLKKLFQVNSLRDLFAANNLPANTSGGYTAVGGSPVRIPFPCSCSKGTGTSYGGPIYTVISGDGLYNISTFNFGGFVTYQEIQAANGIPDANKIDVGQKLKIPLPCSCDEVGGAKVVHYAHKVKAGSSVSEIAEEFGVAQEVLLSLNGINDTLQKDQILDVPLYACNSFIRNDSLDHSLLVPNGSYALTANDCVQCSCNSGSKQLQCTPSEGIKSTECKGLTCPNSNLTIGLSSPGGTPCSLTTCAYAGYGKNNTIFAFLNNGTTCPAGPAPPPLGNSNGSGLPAWKMLGWMELFLIIFASFSIGFL